MIQLTVTIFLLLLLVEELLQLLSRKLLLSNRAGSNWLRCSESLLWLLVESRLLLLWLLLEELLLLLLLRLKELLRLLRNVLESRLLRLLWLEMSWKRINLSILVIISGESLKSNLFSCQLRNWHLLRLFGSKLLLWLSKLLLLLWSELSRLLLSKLLLLLWSKLLLLLLEELLLLLRSKLLLLLGSKLLLLLSLLEVSEVLVKVLSVELI